MISYMMLTGNNKLPTIQYDSQEHPHRKCQLGDARKYAHGLDELSWPLRFAQTSSEPYGRIVIQEELSKPFSLDSETDEAEEEEYIEGEEEWEWWCHQ